MNLVHTLFGEGDDLNILQMTLRAIFVFLIALILLRISGRRSMGMSSPFDYVIIILLGAILSRAIVGTSPFFPVVFASLAIVILHRAFAWIGMHNNTFENLIKGKERIIYKDNMILKNNMKISLITEQDLIESIREQIHEDTLENIECIYVNRNGRISLLKKKIQEDRIKNNSSDQVSKKIRD